MSPLPFPQETTDTGATTSAISTDSTTSATPTSTSGAGPVGNGGGTPASATLLFGFLIIFVALFSAFLLLGFLWQFQRRRRAAQAELLLDFDENGRSGSYGGRVPKLWEVWIQDEPDRWEWENVRPLSVDVGHTTSSGQAITAVSTQTRSRLSWLRNPFRRRPVSSPQPQPQQQQQPASPSQSQSPPEAQQQQQQPDGTGAEAPAALISGVRTSFVIAMPYADAPNRRRSAISQVSSMGENWRRRDYAIGIYHPSFREGFAL